MRAYMPLVLGDPDERISLLRTSGPDMPLLGYDDPAIEIMTDFRRTPAIAVPADAQIDSALDQMIFSGVRLLFVVDAAFNILGSVTSYDIQGEKPMLYMQSRDCRLGLCSRDEITVRDIMTPVWRWRVLNYDGLADATLGDIMETFKRLGQRHIIVVEWIRGRSVQNVRGLFSATVLERALGFPIETSDTATSFAEIKHAIVR